MAIAIENERDEDLGDGAPPQLPAGFLVIVDVSAESPGNWTLSTVNLTGSDAIRFPEDPEPEFVSINADNVVVVTLQENNGLVTVNLTDGSIISFIDAGSTDLTQIDILEEDVVLQTGSQEARLREPDAVAWIGTTHFVTANEGDLDGGSRGFTIYAADGTVVFESGPTMEHIVTAHGHYPEGRSENKGIEPEGVIAAEFDGVPHIFVTSERGSVIAVYDVSDVTAPVFSQILPSSLGPEGLVAIPSRGLLIAACEVDSRDDKIRGGLVVYSFEENSPAYPTLVSDNREDGTPIPFSALSGLVAGPDGVYTVEDSFYRMSRILKIDPSSFPYTVVDEMRVMDSNDVFATAIEGLTTSDGAPLADSVLNDDKTINIDQEGISMAHTGGFWIVHEGAGTVGDVDRPVEHPNVLFKVSAEGVIEKVVLLPAEVNAIQLRFGFEGVSEDGDYVVVAFQRAWGDEANPRLGIYNQVTATWKFVFYPLDAPESQAGGWVGLGDISTFGAGKFLVVERDNQGGPDAAVKRIYSIDLGDYSMEEGTTIEKTLLRDVLDDIRTTNGPVLEKIEGLAIDGDGNVWMNNDNDGVDDNSGERWLWNLGPLVTVSDASPITPPSATTDAPAATPTESPVAAPTTSASASATMVAAVVGTAGALLL